jgi:hypothetical protein
MKGRKVEKILNSRLHSPSSDDMSLAMASDGASMIQSVNALNGSRHVKKETTTAASIKITCFRYLMKLLRLP